jgi:hypothetical protein
MAARFREATTEATACEHGAARTRGGRVGRRPVLTGAAVGVLALLAACARPPYTTDVRTASSVVNFATYAASPVPVVNFGEFGGSCQERQVTAEPPTPIRVSGRTLYQFKVHLDGLTPTTRYCYRVVQGNTDILGDFPSATFRTAPLANDTTPYSFAVVGDWGFGSDAESRVLAQIAASDAQFVVTTGDNEQTGGGQSDYGDVNTGHVFPLRYWPVVGINKPVFPAIGNHDLDSRSSGGLPYLQNFPQDATVAASGGRLRQETYCCTDSHPEPVRLTSGWYAFDWGPARFYVLQAAWPTGSQSVQYRSDFEAHWEGPVPGCAPCGDQLEWLRADLAANRGTNLKFAFFHYPLHSDGEVGGSDRFLNGPAALEGLLANEGVKIAFSGHAHIYQRNTGGTAGSRIVNYVTGGGGGNPTRITSCSSFDAYALGLGSSCRAPVPTSTAQVHHFLHVRVSGNRVTVTPIDSTGRAFDVQTYTFG